MPVSGFPPPPKVRESRFDDWMFRFYRRVDGSGGASSTNVRQFLNVRQYGATGDGTTDDSVAILSAVTAAVSLGVRAIYFPRGTYRLTSAITLSGDFSLFGDGSSMSILKVDHAGNGINYTGAIDTDQEKLTIQSMALRANNSSANAAIYGAWTQAATSLIPVQPCCLIEDVEIGAASSSAAFVYGINLWGASHGYIDRCTVYGAESGTTPSGSYGILLNGGNASGAWVTATAYAVNAVVTQSNLTYKCLVAHTSGTFATDLAAGKWAYVNSTDMRVRDCSIHYCETGIYCLDTEGARITGNTILSCLDGIFFDTTQTIGKPYADVTCNHANVGRYGIRMVEQVQFIVGDNLIYGAQNTPLAGTDFIGVFVQAGSLGAGVETQSIVRDNLVVVVDESGGGYTTNYGYAVYGGAGNDSILFSGNKSQACDTLIYLDSSSTKVVLDDFNIGTDGAVWSDNGTGNSTPRGAYTPTGYGITNCADGDITEYEASWTRTGDVVTVYGDVDVDPTAANTLTTFRLTLPVPSNMGAATQLSGVICASGVNNPAGTAQAHTATSPDRVEFNVWVLFSTATRFSYSYRYRVF